MGLPSSSFHSQLLLVKSASTWNKRFNKFATMKGPKLDLRGDHFWFQGGPLSDPFLNMFPLHGGSKTGPSTDWIRCLLGGPLLSPPKHLLQLPCSNIETHQTNTELAIRASNQGGPNSVSKTHINFRYQKRTQNYPLYLACLGHDNLSLSVLLMKEVPCFQSLQSRRFEARRGLAEATPRTQNVLAQGQSEA